MDNLIMRLAGLTSQKALLFGVGVTALWYFLFFNDGSDLAKRLAQMNKIVQEERSKEKESDIALNEIAAVRASLGSLSDQFKMVSTQLPTDIQMAEIIRTVDKVSQATGLIVKSKEPRAPVRQDTIEVLPLRVSAEGSYSEVTSFFYYLSTIERIVRVRSFRMVGPTDLRKNKKLQLEADVVSYKFIPPEVQKK